MFEQLEPQWSAPPKRRRKPVGVSLMWNPVKPIHLPNATSITAAALERAFGHAPWKFNLDKHSEKLSGLAAALPELLPLLDALADHENIVVEEAY